MRKNEMLGGVAGLTVAAVLIAGCTGSSKHKSTPVESAQSKASHAEALKVGAHVLARLSRITPNGGTTFQVQPYNGTYLDFFRDGPKAADGSFTEYRGDINLKGVVSESELMSDKVNATNIKAIEWSTWRFVGSNPQGMPTGWTTLAQHVDGWATDHPLEQTVPGVTVPSANPSVWDEMLQ